MAPRRIRSIALLFICLSVITSRAQESADLKTAELKTQQHKGLFFLTEVSPTFSLADLKIIDAWNFDVYRKDDTRFKIQLVKGPLIELLSKKELQRFGTVASAPASAIANIPSASSPATKLHEIVMELNIGLGYQKNQHTEVTH